MILLPGRNHWNTNATCHIMRYKTQIYSLWLIKELFAVIKNGNCVHCSRVSSPCSKWMQTGFWTSGILPLRCQVTCGKPFLWDQWLDLLYTCQRHEDAQTSFWRNATPRPIIRSISTVQFVILHTKLTARLTRSYAICAVQKCRERESWETRNHHNQHPQNPLGLSTSLHLQGGTNTSQGLGASNRWIQTLHFYLHHCHHHDHHDPQEKLKQGTWSRSLAGAPKTAKMASPMYSMTTPSKLSILRFGQGLFSGALKVLNKINFDL